MTKEITSSVLSKTKSFIALSAAILLSACTSSDSTLEVYASETDASNEIANNAITEAIDNTIIPAANNFQTQAQNLLSKSNTFCADNIKTADNLITTQEQWKTTQSAWFELLPFRFGPLLNSILFPTYTFIDSYRLRGDDYTSEIRTKIDVLLASADDIDETTFSSMTFQFTGLLALEIALFEDAANESSDSDDVLNEFNNQARKCQILTGYATELVRRADIIQQAWISDYRSSGRSYRDLVINGDLDTVLLNESGDSAIKKVTVSMQEFYDYVANRSITSDAGQLSNSIWQALEKSLQSTESLLQGTTVTELSLNSIMQDNQSAQTVLDIQENIDTMRATLIEENSVDMIAAAKILDGNFKREIPDALNVSLGLNFSDGD